MSAPQDLNEPMKGPDERDQRSLPRWICLAGAVFVVATAMLIARSAHAADQTWKGTGTSAWTTASNWLGNAVPGSASGTTNGDTATFAVGTNLAVTPDAERNIKNILFDTGAGAFTFSGGGFVLTDGGAITINSGVTNTQTFSSPIVLFHNNGATYSFINNSATAGVNLIIGNVTGDLGNNGHTSTLTLAGTNNGSVGKISDGDKGKVNVTKSGTGTWTLTGANTYTGGTNVNQGTLVASVGSLVSVGGGVTVNSGGTLLLSGNGRHLGSGVTVNLNGGTFNTGGLSEPTGALGGQFIGALTLSATSTINFGAGNSSVLEFAGIGAHAPTSGPDLLVTNWDGMPVIGGSGDRLLFNGLVADFTSKFAQADVSFNGVGGYTAVQFDLFGANPYYEITSLVAIPEPSTAIGAALALGFVVWPQRRRLVRFVRRAA